ncbi:hypothetical protein NPIL_307741 [Nephila pilipes]|uniref:Uncharacterized protein n=1 Tax=Nephila pilipes TaxID=299642 RepID=A0A8X6U5F9_NEPPI|nr:hypothetical protein NPIL_307741 [Nephila pilipes]
MRITTTSPYFSPPAFCKYHIPHLLCPPLMQQIHRPYQYRKTAAAAGKAAAYRCLRRPLAAAKLLRHISCHTGTAYAPHFRFRFATAKQPYTSRLGLPYHKKKLW